MNNNQQNENQNWQRLQVLSNTDSVRYPWALGRCTRTQNGNKFCDCLRLGPKVTLATNIIYSPQAELEDKGSSYRAKHQTHSIKLFWIWIRSGKDNLSRQRSTYFPLMGRELQVILGVQAWQCMTEIQLLVHNVTLRDIYSKNNNNRGLWPLYLTGSLTNTQGVGAVPAGLESRSHCELPSSSEWWRWGAALTSRSRKFCVWPLLPHFDPCASMRTTIRQVSSLLLCVCVWGGALLLGNAKKETGTWSCWKLQKVRRRFLRSVTWMF